MPDEMTPQVLKGLVRDGKELTGLRVSYKPQEPWHLVLIADPDDRAVKLEVDLAIVPRLGGEDASFAGRLGHLTVEMRVNFTSEGLQVFEPSFDYDFAGARADDFLQGILTDDEFAAAKGKLLR